MLGATEEEEMAQFYIVNSKAKSVRTDLALELLKQLTDRNPEMMEALTEKGKDWQIQAQQLVRELAEASRSGGAAFASRPWIREILRCLQRPWSHHSNLFLPRLTLRRWT